ncbi:MAG: tail fiber domain-containing protein, partial [Bacteroidota bacterium]
EINENGENLKLLGEGTSFLGFYPQGAGTARTGYIGFTANDNVLRIQQEASAEMEFGTSGSLIRFKNPVHIHANRRTNYSRYTSHEYDQHQTWSRSAPTDYYSLTMTHKVAAIEFHAFSDQRIKKDLRLSNGTTDLQTLQQIEVTDYRHIDEVEYGAEYKKGLIAQQVKSVFPEAITIAPAFIPNLFSKPKKLIQNKQYYVITMDQAHELKPGDLVKVITPNAESEIKVSKVYDEQSFTVEASETSIDQETFFYGKKVEDFHTVDYDRVFTLNVSATQELARKVATLEKENARLKSNATRTDELLDKLTSKIENLEAVIQMTVSNRSERHV